MFLSLNAICSIFGVVRHAGFNHTRWSQLIRRRWEGATSLASEGAWWEHEGPVSLARGITRFSWDLEFCNTCGHSDTVIPFPFYSARSFVLQYFYFFILFSFLSGQVFWKQKYLQHWCYSNIIYYDIYYFIIKKWVYIRNHFPSTEQILQILDENVRKLRQINLKIY